MRSHLPELINGLSPEARQLCVQHQLHDVNDVLVVRPKKLIVHLKRASLFEDIGSDLLLSRIVWQGNVSIGKKRFSWGIRFKNQW